MRILGLLAATILLGFAPPAPTYAVTESGEEIAHLLDFVAGSPCTFIRNGRAYPAVEARVHLERKYAALKDRIRTAEDFISLAASRSSVSGEPYRVRCDPGGEQETSAWLSAELQRFRRQPR
jgi:hypothetical protein